MILNPKQTQAVKHIDGPLMVVAGPGTGKTQLLSARILEILKNTDMLPENILCLTFTDAATTAMRNRLVSMVGSTAFRVPIYTFHSFCQKIINDFQFELGFNQLEPVSELEKIEMIHTLIDSWPNGHPLKNYKYPYGRTKEFLELIALIKQERFDKDSFIRSVDQIIADLPNREDMYYKKKSGNNKKGDLRAAFYKQELDKMEKLKAAIIVSFEYMETLVKNGRYDFNDMILSVIKLLSEHPYALLNYQEQYQYIMVDEYQDTNKAQNDLVFLLSNYWESPNLMVVGDDDQSIYRFQGADIENLVGFEKKYEKDLLKVVLEDNYRSTQQILDSAKKVIQNNKERLVEHKNLVARKNIETKFNPVILKCYNEVYEAAQIYNLIKDSHDSGIPYREMAVIYRNHKQGETIRDYLNYKGIPLSLKKKNNVLEEPFIINICALLRYISYENRKPYSGDPLLFKILHFDFWEIPAVDIAKLAYYLRGSGMKWRNCLAELDRQTELTLILSHEAITKLRKLSADIEYWISKSFNLPSQQLLEKVISKGGILSYVMQNPSKRYLLQVMQTFFNYLKNESRKNRDYTIEQFLNSIELLNDNYLSMEAEEIIEKKDAVNLLTAHASKGLEFDLVMVVSCNLNAWDKTKDRVPFSLRSILSHNIDSLMEENRRLFYVALTRAKTRLYISYQTQDLSEKTLNKSQFVQEIMESGIPIEKEAEIKEDQIMEVQRSGLEANDPEKNFDLLDKEYLNQLTENYVLSATHLDTYLDCPLKFYYRNLLQIPSAKTPALSFGNAIHKSLELFFKSMLDDPDKNYPDAGQLVLWYQNDLEKNKDSFTKEDFNRYLEYGKEKVLPQLYRTFLSEWNENKNRVPEKNLSDIVVKEVPIKGKLDQLVITDKHHVHVIDYKTGKFDSKKYKTLMPPVLDPETEKTSAEEMYGGNYWRQVAFYHLLINNDPLHSYKTLSGEMFFVEPLADGSFERRKIFVSDEELVFMENLLVEVYQKIKNHEFEKGCGKENCEWCNFNSFYLKGKTYSSENLLEDGSEL
ncbi:MAG: ATP-dependent helicase [Flavobacteriales bacterium]|nr:ATP-dependent helicase [Flavobacteriales bacterium]